MKHPPDRRLSIRFFHAFPRIVMVAAAGTAAFFFACRVFPEWETISVVPPSLPTAWSELGLNPEWEFRVCWPGGEIRSTAGAGEEATFRVPRDERVAVLAYPFIRDRCLRPAGIARSAFDFPAEPLTLTWDGGYQADAARVLVRAGKDPSLFDLDRFLAEAKSRMDDPWNVPPDTFVEYFAEGTFRVNWLNPPEEYETVISGMPGPAASDSPFGQTLVPDEQGDAIASLPAGIHCWYASWGRVSAEVFEDGSAAWIVATDP